MKKIFILFLVAILLLPVGVRAMSVEPITDYNDYTIIGFFKVFRGWQIDSSTAGVTFFMPNTYSSGLTNITVLDLNSPDGTTTQWWVWVRMVNMTNGSYVPAVVVNPPDITFRLQCGVSGGTYNISSSSPNSTWNSGYTLFRLTYDTEEMHEYATADYTSPTGRDLYTLQRICYFQVYPDEFPSGDVVYVSVWNVNPSRNAICSIDPAVSSIESSTLGIIDMNFQIWTILFDLFSVAVILLAIFGIPVLLIKLVRWIFDEVKKMMGGRKVL